MQKTDFAKSTVCCFSLKYGSMRMWGLQIFIVALNYDYPACSVPAETDWRSFVGIPISAELWWWRSGRGGVGEWTGVNSPPCMGCVWQVLSKCAQPLGKQAYLWEQTLVPLTPEACVNMWFLNTSKLLGEHAAASEAYPSHLQRAQIILKEWGAEITDLITYEIKIIPHC